MFGIERANFNNTSMIKLTFDQNVEITEYYYPEFSVSDFLAKVFLLIRRFEGMCLFRRKMCLGLVSLRCSMTASVVQCCDGGH